MDNSIYTTYLPLLVIVLTAISSYIGFNNASYFDRNSFNVGAILGKSKQWDRLVTSAALHADYMHLLFNMLTLYFFSDIIIASFGVWQYFAIYLGSIVGGSLLSLWMHRREYYYTAIGASGGVSGILFAAIALHPDMGLGLFLIPIPISAWIFGIAYLAFSIYGMHASMGNVGHDAHLGGATVGLVCAILFKPTLLEEHLYYILLMLLPLLLLAYYVWKKK